jgi:hypothetical protein
VFGIYLCICEILRAWMADPNAFGIASHLSRQSETGAEDEGAAEQGSAGAVAGDGEAVVDQELVDDVEDDILQRQLEAAADGEVEDQITDEEHDDDVSVLCMYVCLNVCMFV